LYASQELTPGPSLGKRGEVFSPPSLRKKGDGGMSLNAAYYIPIPAIREKLGNN
jgi:hypothetical protein